MKKRSRFDLDDTPLSEKDNISLKRVNVLVDWLEKQKPSLPIVVNKGLKVYDYEKCLKAHKNALQNTRVNSPAWRAYANNLAAIKVSIDKQVNNEKKIK